jgi:uncharacterized membrane protein YfcA
MTAKEHNRYVGIALLVHSAFYSIIMLIACVIYGFLGVAIATNVKNEEAKFAGNIFIIAILFIAFFAICFVTPQIIAGWKLLKEKQNSKTWGIIGSCFACLSFPFGTAAGIYGLWFLLGDVGKNYYSANNSNKDMFENPPPPQNWA